MLRQFIFMMQQKGFTKEKTLQKNVIVGIRENLVQCRKVYVDAYLTQ